MRVLWMTGAVTPLVGAVLGCAGAPSVPDRADPVSPAPPAPVAPAAAAPEPAAAAPDEPAEVSREVAIERAVALQGVPELVEVHHLDGPDCYSRFSLEVLAPLRAEATSSLTGDALVHGPERVFDGDPGTAWVEGVDGDGAGEGLVVWLDLPDLGYRYHPIAIGVLPGDAGDAERSTSRNRVRSFLLRFLVPRDPEDSGPYEWSNVRYMGSDSLRLDVGEVRGEAGWVYFEFPERNREAGEMVGFELSILEVDGEGAAVHETAVSELVLYTAGGEIGRQCTARYCAGEGRGSFGCPPMP